MKLNLKSLIIIIFASFLFLIITDINTHPSSMSEFEKLGYGTRDFEILNSNFSKAEIKFIIDNDIRKEELFPYLTINAFSLKEIKAYENIRINKNVSHLVAVNIKHH